MSSSITSWMNIMLMGAHVSASGGYFRGIERGMELGCESIQIFPSAPHSWATKPILQEEITTFSNTLLLQTLLPYISMQYIYSI